MQFDTGSAPAPSSEIAAVSQRLDRLHGLAAAPMFQRIASSMRDSELTFSQLNALYRLYVHGPQSIKALAAAAGLTHPAASRMVDRLVRSGLVVRSESASDRRHKRVELTEAGLRQLSGLRALTADVYATLLESIPAAALRRLSDALEELAPYLPVGPTEALHVFTGMGRTSSPTTPESNDKDDHADHHRGLPAEPTRGGRSVPRSGRPR